MSATEPTPVCPAFPANRTRPAHVPPAPAGTGDILALSDIVSSPDARAVYRRMREQWGNVARVELEPGVYAWLVMGYWELLTVTRREQFFSRDPRNWRDLNHGVVSPQSELMPMMAHHPSCYHADGQEHRRLRRPFDESLRLVDQRRARRMIERRCTNLIARFSKHGTADLIGQYASLVPIISLGALFGLTAEQGEELVRDVYSVVGSGEGAEASFRDMDRVVMEMMERPERPPTDDLTWSFVHNPALQTVEERFYAVHVMLIGANMPTISWIAQTFRLLFTDPRFGARLRGGQLGVDDALEEALWWDPPVYNMPARYVLHEVEIGGRVLQPGDCVIMGIAAANDDPAIQQDSQGSDWNNRAHLSFSAGPHVCPAQEIARLIVRTAVSTLMNLLPDVQLSLPVEELSTSPSPWTRIPARLPVHFTPVGITEGGVAAGADAPGSPR